MAYDRDLAERLRAEFAVVEAASEKPMFGGLAFLVGGHLAAAVSGRGGLMVRVPREDTEALLREPHTSPMIMRGREAAGWLRVSAEGVAGDDQLQRWVALGVHTAHAAR